MASTIFPNTRYYRFDESDNHLDVVRVLKYQNSDTLKCEFIKGPSAGKKEKMKISDLHDNWCQLSFDGIISISIVQLQNLKDVVATLVRKSDIDSVNASMPYAVCRQCVSDIFHYVYTKQDKEMVGMSVTWDSCPANVEFKNFLACDKMLKQFSMVYYIGDSLKDLLTLFDHSEYDYVLNELFVDHCKFASSGIQFVYDDYMGRDILDGYVKTLDDLLTTNNFEYDVQSGFGIIPLKFDFKGDISGKIDMNSAGELSENAKKELGFILGVNINTTLVMPYDKDIDLKSLSHRLYVLISDLNNDIYLVVYDTIGDYHVPIEDVESEENIQKINNMANAKSAKEACQYININMRKYNI